MHNIFRLSGDLAHLLSIVLLLQKIQVTRSVSGLSFKTQYLYMIVYVTRYLDLVTRSWSSWYNTIFKFIYLGSTGYILWLMTSKLRSTRSPPKVDTFKVQYLIGVSAVMALLFHTQLTIVELLWSFSIWLESVAILPQLFIIQRTGKCETMTTHYIFALGLYRAFYIFNWIYKGVLGPRSDDLLLSFAGGFIQTLLYSDFFYVYYTKVYQGQSFTLPV